MTGTGASSLSTTTSSSSFTSSFTEGAMASASVSSSVLQVVLCVKQDDPSILAQLREEEEAEEQEEEEEEKESVFPAVQQQQQQQQREGKKKLFPPVSATSSSSRCTMMMRTTKIEKDHEQKADEAHPLTPPTFFFRPSTNHPRDLDFRISPLSTSIGWGRAPTSPSHSVVLCLPEQRLISSILRAAGAVLLRVEVMVAIFTVETKAVELECGEQERRRRTRRKMGMNGDRHTSAVPTAGHKRDNEGNAFGSSSTRIATTTTAARPSRMSTFTSSAPDYSVITTKNNNRYDFPSPPVADVWRCRRLQRIYPVVQRRVRPGATSLSKFSPFEPAATATRTRGGHNEDEEDPGVLVARGTTATTSCSTSSAHAANGDDDDDDDRMVLKKAIKVIGEISCNTTEEEEQNKIGKKKEAGAMKEEGKENRPNWKNEKEDEEEEEEEYDEEYDDDEEAGRALAIPRSSPSPQSEQPSQVQQQQDMMLSSFSTLNTSHDVDAHDLLPPSSPPPFRRSSPTPFLSPRVLSCDTAIPLSTSSPTSSRRSSDSGAGDGPPSIGEDHAKKKIKVETPPLQYLSFSISIPALPTFLYPFFSQRGRTMHKKKMMMKESSPSPFLAPSFSRLSFWRHANSLPSVLSLTATVLLEDFVVQVRRKPEQESTSTTMEREKEKGKEVLYPVRYPQGIWAVLDRTFAIDERPEGWRGPPPPSSAPSILPSSATTSCSSSPSSRSLSSRVIYFRAEETCSNVWPRRSSSTGREEGDGVVEHDSWRKKRERHRIVSIPSAPTRLPLNRNISTMMLQETPGSNRNRREVVMSTLQEERTSTQKIVAPAAGAAAAITTRQEEEANEEEDGVPDAFAGSAVLSEAVKGMVQSLHQRYDVRRRARRRRNEQKEENNSNNEMIFSTSEYNPSVEKEEEGEDSSLLPTTLFVVVLPSEIPSPSSSFSLCKTCIGLPVVRTLSSFLRSHAFHFSHSKQHSHQEQQWDQEGETSASLSLSSSSYSFFTTTKTTTADSSTEKQENVLHPSHILKKNNREEAKMNEQKDRKRSKMKETAEAKKILGHAPFFSCRLLLLQCSSHLSFDPLVATAAALIKESSFPVVAADDCSFSSFLEGEGYAEGTGGRWEQCRTGVIDIDPMTSAAVGYAVLDFQSSF